MTLDFSSKVQNLALIFGIDLAQPPMTFDIPDPLRGSVPAVVRPGIPGVQRGRVKHHY